MATGSNTPGTRIAGWIAGVLLPIEPFAALAWLGGVLAWTELRRRRSEPTVGPIPPLPHATSWRMPAFVWGPALVIGAGYALAGDGPWLMGLAAGGIVVTGGLGAARVRVSRGVVPGLITGFFALSALGVGHLAWERIAWNDAPTTSSTIAFRAGSPTVRVDARNGALAGAATWRVPEGASSMQLAVRVETEAPTSAPPRDPNGASSDGVPQDAEAFVEVVWRDGGDRNLARRTVALLPTDGTTSIDERLALPRDGEARWMRVLMWLPPSATATLGNLRITGFNANGRVLDAERRAPTRWNFGAGHPNLAGHGWALLGLATVATAPTTWGALAAGAGGLTLTLSSGSRAALAVFLIALPVLVWLRRRHHANGPKAQPMARSGWRRASGRRGFVALATGVVTLLLAGLWLASDLGRDVALTDLTHRPDAVRVAIDAIADHPGSGPPQPFADLHCAAVTNPGVCLTHPHNVVLEAGIHHGLPGLVSVAWIFIGLFIVAAARRDATATTLIGSAFVLNLADPSLLEPTLLAGLGIGMTARHAVSKAARAPRATFLDES